MCYCELPRINGPVGRIARRRWKVRAPRFGTGMGIGCWWLERVAWIHFYKLFWSSSSGTSASSLRSSNLFTLSCLGMNIFISTFPWSFISLSTSTSCHSGNTLLCKETIQCRSTTSGLIVIPHYNDTPSPWDTLLEMRLTTQYSRRNRFDKMVGRIKHSTLSKFWRPIL